ncbi:hypothetical protein M8C21_018862, partial [Ambrosia artemisiifolia]
WNFLLFDVWNCNWIFSVGSGGEGSSEVNSESLSAKSIHLQRPIRGANLVTIERDEQKKYGEKVLLFREKRLCEQVFSESELIKEISFVETAKGCVMQLLNFGEAVTIGQRSSEKLFRILDMYDVVADVLLDFEMLFTDESGESVCNEVKVVLSGLGEATIGTFVEVENAVKGENSRRALQGGEIHPTYSETLNCGTDYY